MNSNTLRQSITKLVPLLERLSLLGIQQEALDRVVRCVEFANKINELDDKELANVEPMISPAHDQDQCCFMRDDGAKFTDRNEITKNASILVEDYFVTPSKHKHYSDF